MPENRLLAVQIAASAAMFLTLVCWGIKGHPREVVLKAYDMVCMGAKKKRGRLWNYESMERFLRINGAAYHYGKWINPVSYTFLCCAMSGAGIILGMYFGRIYAIGGAVVFWALPGILTEHFNRKDNESMLTELNLIYNALAIQIRAGVYVTDALAECCTSVEGPRLREALATLSGDIVMKADLEEALERFQQQFSNKYIDSLCITILQAMESGQAVELLGDIAGQIKDMELTMQNRKKERLDRSITFYQLGIFAAIIVVVLYACLENLFASGMFTQGASLF